MRWLITGSAGFIGYHVAAHLLNLGHEVAGVDGMTPYYDVSLKEKRHALLREAGRFTSLCAMIESSEKIAAFTTNFAPEVVLHLAGQAGVRFSLVDPGAYVKGNVLGGYSVLELCRAIRPKHVLIASTSSVYGDSGDFPLVETAQTDWPLTPYAASKKALEVVAHTYSHLWDLPITICRFFTVYGPWGRPDMAVFKFVTNILSGLPIDVFNHGRVVRDYTYVDDVVRAVVALSDVVPAVDRKAGGGDTLSAVAPYRIVNIGGNQPVGLLDLISEIERATGRTAIRNYVSMQAGDVPRTEASSELLQTLISYSPTTPIRAGISEFVAWYKSYYGGSS